MSNWINGNLQGRLSPGQGEPGKSLEYMWRGTELGIRVEGEEEYQFVNLAGGGTGREIELQVGNGYLQWRYKDEEEWNNLISIDSLKGEPGEQGLPGKDGVNGENGKSLEFNWNGTELGVRQEDQPSYSYVNLKGKDGKDGANGIDGVDGKDGKDGKNGQDGADGVTPNIQIGTVTTLEPGEKATVVNSGTKENPIFDFGIPKGENGVGGTGVGSGVAQSDKVDYMGKQHDSLKETNDSNVEYLLRKVNTQKYVGSSITANNTYMKQVNNVILKGVTKFKDLNTGEFIDSFEEGRNLELVGGKTNKILAENHLDAIRANLITMAPYYDTADIIKTDNSNFIIKTTGQRYSGVISNYFFTAEIGGSQFGKYVVEFDGKLISGNLSSVIGLKFEGWSTFMSGYDGKLPIDGKYKAVIQSSTNTVNDRGTCIQIFPSTTTGSSAVEYEIKNLKIYCVTDPNSEYKSSELMLLINTPLYSIRDVCDYIDLNTGVYVKNIEMRTYQSGDESNSEVITDKKTTIYKLEQPIVSKIDLQGQKIYSYDGTTYYTCQSESGYPAPILSMEVPTDLASLVQEQKVEIKLLHEVNKEQDELINTTMLATDEMYMMLEPLLTNMLVDGETISPLVNMYAAMVQRGLKTIEQIPKKWREQVKKILDQLEK